MRKGYVGGQTHDLDEETFRDAEDQPGAALQDILKQRFGGKRKRLRSAGRYLLTTILETLAVEYYRAKGLTYEVAFQKGLIQHGVTLLSRRLATVWEERNIAEVYQLQQRAIPSVT